MNRMANAKISNEICSTYIYNVKTVVCAGVFQFGTTVQDGLELRWFVLRSD